MKLLLIMTKIATKLDLDC